MGAVVAAGATYTIYKLLYPDPHQRGLICSGRASHGVFGGRVAGAIATAAVRGERVYYNIQRDSPTTLAPRFSFTDRFVQILIFGIFKRMGTFKSYFQIIKISCAFLRQKRRTKTSVFQIKDHCFSVIKMFKSRITPLQNRKIGVLLVI